jgi:hypothetical protein
VVSAADPPTVVNHSFLDREHSPYHVRNSTEFVHVLSSLRADPHDIMVSFDIVSPFTRVSIEETLDILGRHFEEEILGLSATL